MHQSAKWYFSNSLIGVFPYKTESSPFEWVQNNEQDQEL